MKKKYLTDIMKAEKINSKGEITAWNGNFEKPDEEFFFPFSIFIVPKSWISNGVISVPVGDGSIGLNMTCKLIGDNSYSEFPIRFGEWTPSTIISLQANTISLSLYRVFWGSGEIVE